MSFEDFDTGKDFVPVRYGNVLERENAIIIAGSRKFKDESHYMYLKTYMDEALRNILPEDILILSGGAWGADKLGERYAVDRFLPYLVMPALWEDNGKVAGVLRNEDMAKIATHCVVFRIDKSRGATNMYENALKYGLKARLIDYS